MTASSCPDMDRNHEGDPVVMPEMELRRGQPVDYSLALTGGDALPPDSEVLDRHWGHWRHKPGGWMKRNDPNAYETLVDLVCAVGPVTVYYIARRPTVTTGMPSVGGALAIDPEVPRG